MNTDIKPVQLRLEEDDKLVLHKPDCVGFVFDQQDAELIQMALKWFIATGLCSQEAEQARDLLQRVVEGKVK